MIPAGVEPTACCLGGSRSILLSYETMPPCKDARRTVYYSISGGKGQLGNSGSLHMKPYILSMDAGICKKETS